MSDKPNPALTPEEWGDDATVETRTEDGEEIQVMRCTRCDDHVRVTDRQELWNCRCGYVGFYPVNVVGEEET